MRVEKIAPGLWRWSASAPDWKEKSEWAREVWSVYCEPPAGGIVLIDPLLPEAGSADRAKFDAAFKGDRARVGGKLTVLLTVADHRRSADEFAAAGIPVFAARGAFPRLAGLPVKPLSSASLARLGIAAIPLAGVEPGETAFWIARRRALVIGDALTGDMRVGEARAGLGAAPRHWSPDPAAYDRKFPRALASLAALSPRIILAAHAEAVTRGAAARMKQIAANGLLDQRASV